MNTRKLIAVVALLASAAVSRPELLRPAAPPVPGPGGVAYAVLDFLQRQDAGEGLGAMLVDRAPEVDFVMADGKLAVAEQGTSPGAFLDVGADGAPLGGADAAQFAKLLAGRIATDEAAARVLTSELRTIRANCDSARCSTAVFTFDRRYRNGKQEVTVPMRGTALLRYDSDDNAFRIFHWHASRREAAKNTER